MRRTSGPPALPLVTFLVTLLVSLALDPMDIARAGEPPRYYAHPAVLDRHGVIAPWYRGQNGQLDQRAHIALETLRRYPWALPPKAPAPAPEFIYSGAWKIDPDGTIHLPPISNWANGDLAQRAAYVIGGLLDEFAYSGDTAALALASIQVEAVLSLALTPDDHPWPRFPVTVPVRGVPYGRTDPHGWIQLDIASELGIQVLRAARITRNERWMEAVRHWGDLLAEKRETSPGLSPWPRYANPEDVPWEDHATGGVAFTLEFLDGLIRSGWEGKDGAILAARKAGVDYLREVLLPNWTGGETWGRNYWDWPCPVQVENVTEFVVRYLMEHPTEFPNWKRDARNILTLFLHRTSVSPDSRGGVYAGAWAYPESSGCCGRSLWYGPLELASVYAQYGILAGSEWALEMARRQGILATYDVHETGVVEDGIDGGPIVAGDWFKIAHPMALRHVLALMAWMPETFAPARENHILRSTSLAIPLEYGDGLIRYRTVDAPSGTVDLLRLAFRPKAVRAGRSVLAEQTSPAAQTVPAERNVPGKQTAPAERALLGERVELLGNGYAVRDLACGDSLVTIRHDGLLEIQVEGDDPQEAIGAKDLAWTGSWSEGPEGRTSSEAGATVVHAFRGNQVRVLGRAGPRGGLADVSIDGRKQPSGIDGWLPEEALEGLRIEGAVDEGPESSVLFSKSGLGSGPHEIRIVVRGDGNPLSHGHEVTIQGLQVSAAQGESDFGEGGGSSETQRWVFGRTSREDYVDAEGHAWRPATEFVLRVGHLVDPVVTSWWTQRTRLAIQGTRDPELYRYGVHAKDLEAWFTVGPGTYHARVKFVETRNIAPRDRAIDISVNGRVVARAVDLAATAREPGEAAQAQRPGDPYALWSGLHRAVDLVFDGIAPEQGCISIRISGSFGGEAIVQAIEVGPGEGGPGARPVSLADEPTAPTARPASADGNLLANPGFEEGAAGDLGAFGKTGGGHGWSYVFAGAAQAYAWAESAYSAHPDWGLPAVRSGKEAIRTHADAGSHTLIHQDAAAKPSTRYVASAWIRAVDLRGKGFGRDAREAAVVRVLELTASGSVAADHATEPIRAAGDFKEARLEFTAKESTVRLRIVLDTVIHCPYDEGHVTYDDIYLGEEGPR